MPPKKDPRRYVIEDHLCRKCGGRILRCVSGSGPTGGGNPVYRCADCGASASGLSPGCLCWCGFAHRHQDSGSYMCLPFAGNEEFTESFRSCGCEPGLKSEVGIVVVDSLRKQVGQNG